MKCRVTHYMLPHLPRVPQLYVSRPLDYVHTVLDQEAPDRIAFAPTRNLYRIGSVHT